MAPEAPEASERPPRGTYRIAFGLALGCFALATLGGLYHSFRASGRPPAVWELYGPRIQALIEQNDLEPVVKQLRVAAQIDLENQAMALRLTESAAREAGDRETEVWALRRLVRTYPQSDAFRQRLVEAEAALQ